MNKTFWLVCVVAVILSMSVATAATPRVGTGGGHSTFTGSRGAFVHNGVSAFHGGNFRRHHHDSDFFFFGGFGFPFWGVGYPYWGYPYPYPYGYGYYPYYGSPYYGYGASSYGGSGSYSGVVQLQRRLVRAGYYHGRIDGIMGPRTREALRAYQRDHHTG
jgi:hypothetical protein